MGYHAPGTKMLNIARHRGEPGVAPTVANARNGTYPITRPLLIYAIGQPAGLLQDYMDWIMGPQGQKVVGAVGFVPLEVRRGGMLAGVGGI